MAEISLGSLMLELGLDASSYNRSLNNAKAAAQQAGKTIERSLKVAPTFDAALLQQQIKQVETQKPAIAVGVKLDKAQVDRELTQNGAKSISLTASIVVDSRNVAQLKAQLERSLQLTVSTDAVAPKARKVEFDTQGLEDSLASAVTKGSKKAQARAGPLGFLTGGLQNTIRGFQEGVGATYAKKFTDGSIRNLEATLGKDLEEIGARVSMGFAKAGKFAGDRIVKRLGIEEGLAGVDAKVKQTAQFFNEIIDTKTLDRKFSVLETQVGKLIDDLLRLKGLGAQVGNLKGIAGAVGDIAATPLEGVEIRRQRLVKDAAQQAQVRAAQIEAPKYENADSVVFGIGGFAGNEDKALRGKSSIPVAERLQLLTGERNPVVPVENQATDLSVNIGEGKLKFFAEAMQKIVMQNLAISPDAIETAAQAIAVRRENPDLPIGVAGYSAGGFTARSSAEILKEAGVDQVRAVGIGTPRFSSKSSTTKEQFQTILGKGDPLSRTAKLSGATDAQIFEDGGKAHKLSSYLSAGDTQGAILKQLNIKREIPAELKSPVAFELKAVEQDIDAAANDFMAAMQGTSFYMKTGLYKTVIAKIKINREKLAMLMEQATGDLDQVLAGYDEQLAEAETMLNQTFGTQKQAAPALKARQREEAILQTPAIPPPVQAPLRTKPLDATELNNYNADILKEVSRLSGGTGKGKKDEIVKQLLEADARSVREAIAAIEPLIQTGPKGGQSIKRVSQSSEEKRAIAATKDAEKRINDTLRIFVDASGKRREEIATAANNEINATLAELDKLKGSQSPDTRLQAGRTRGRLESLRTNFNAGDVEGLARSPGAMVREGAVKASAATARSFGAEPSDSIRTNLSRTAKTPRAKAIATDLAVNTAGFAASQLGNNFGVVPGLAGDLVGALVARQAIAASAEIFKAYRASTSKQFGEIAKQAIASMRGRGFQREMGANLTGDLTGFAIGNASAMAANAGLGALNGIVPGAGMLAKVPLKGAVAAMATVPKIVNARERALPVEELELARVSEQPQPKRGLMSGLVNRAKADSEKAKAAIAASLNKTMDVLEERYIKPAPAPTAAPVKPATPKPAAASKPNVAVQMQQAAKVAQKQVERLPQELALTTNQTYQLLVQEAAKLSRVTIKPGDLPRLMVDDAKLKGIGARALYSIKNNQIIITSEVAAMLSGTISQIEKQQEAIKDVVHEARHSFQFDFGRSNIAKQSLGFSQPGVPLAPIQELPRNLQYNAMRSAQVANQQAGGILPQSFQRTIARTEADAYAFETQAPKVFGNVAQRVRSGAPLPQPMQAENQPNQGMVDFFVKAFQAKRAVGNAISNPIGAIGNVFESLKASALGGVGSQVAVARAPQVGGGLSGLKLPEIKIPEGLKQFGALLTGTRQQADGFGTRLKALSASIDQLIPGSGALLGNLKQMAVGFASFFVLQQAIGFLKGLVSESLNAAMNLDRLKTAMNFAAGGAAVGGENMKFVEQTVSDLKIPLNAAREGFTQFSAATRGTKVEGQATKDVFMGMSQAATVLGLSADSTSGAFLALGQMASKGKVQAEELRGQLGERIPGAFGIAARAMGVTEGELNKMLETGQVLAEDFLPKFGAQLKKEFGGSAVDASKNAQSAMFEFQNQTLKSQEAFGKLIQPAQVAALNLASGAIKFLTDNSAALAPVLVTIAAALGLTLVNTLLQVPGVAAAANAAFGLLRAGIGQTLAMMLPLALQIAVVYAAIEVGRNIFDRFVPSDLGKRFEESTGSIQGSLDKISEAARRARGEIAAIKPPNPNEDLKPNGIVDQGIQQAKRLDESTGGGVRGAIKGIANAVPVAGLATDLAKRAGIRFETSSAAQFRTDKENVGKFTETANKAANFDENAAMASLVDTKSADEDLKRLQYRKDALKGATQPDKIAIAGIDKQIAEKTAGRSKAGEGFGTQYEAVNKALKEAQSNLKAIQDTNLPDSYKKQLTEPVEKSIVSLQAAKDKMDALQQSVGTVIDPTRKLLGAFEAVNTKIEEINRNAQRTFNDKMFTVNTQALKGFDTDVDASGKTGVAKAEADKERIQTQLEGTDAQLDLAQSAINDPTSREILSSMTTSGGQKISENSSIAEIENAKKRLGDKDQPKKDVLDQLKAYKEARDKQAELRPQLPAAELAIKEANQQLTMSQLSRATADQDAVLKRNEITRSTALIPQRTAITQERAALTNQRAKNTFYSDADANVAGSAIGIKEADLGVAQARAQIANTKDQEQAAAGALERLRDAYDRGKISAEQFHNQERDLTTQVAEARGKSIEASAALQDAFAKRSEAVAARIEAQNKKLMEQVDEMRQKALAAVQLTQTRQTTALQGGLLNSADAGELSQGQAGRSQTLIEQSAATARLAIKEKELADNKMLLERGAINRKEYADRERAITQELADAEGAQVQRQIQMQQQLRDSRIKLLEGTAKLEADQIDRAKQLADAQGGLLKAQMDLNLARTQGQLNKADRAVGLADRLESQKDLDPRVKKVITKQLNESGISGVNANSKSYEILAAKNKLENDIAEKTKAAREQEFALARQSFEFDVKKQAIANNMLVIESKRYQLDASRAKIQALKDYRDAEKSGDAGGMQLAKASFEIAGNQSLLADEQLKAANDRLETDKQLAEIGRQTLGINQQKTREEAFGADQIRRQNNEIAYADQFVKAGEQGNIVLPARANGGDVTGGRPYMVGERGQEIFVPKVNGEILPAYQTERLANAVSTAGMSAKEIAIAQQLQMAKLPARANGGSVTAGQAYKVGERGREAVLNSAYKPPVIRSPIYGTGVGSVGEYKAPSLTAAMGVGGGGKVGKAEEAGQLLTKILADTSGILQKLGVGAPAIATPPASSSIKAPTIASGGMMNKEAPSISSGSVGGPSGDLGAKMDKLIAVIGSAINSPRSLTVSTTAPVQDAAKIMSDIATQNTSNAGL